MITRDPTYKHWSVANAGTSVGVQSKLTSAKPKTKEHLLQLHGFRFGQRRVELAKFVALAECWLTHLQGLPPRSSGLFGIRLYSLQQRADWLLGLIGQIESFDTLGVRVGRCGATENRLHIYKRPCCAGLVARAQIKNRSVGLHSLPSLGLIAAQRVSRVHQLPV